jgi:4-carboxymuconolactone decarboxylase
VADNDPRIDRFSTVARETLAPDAQAIWDARLRQVSTTTLSGHFNVLMHAPELCARVSALEGYFRTESTLSARERELVTLATLRAAKAHFAWSRHEQRALEVGISRETVEAVRAQASPEAFRGDERLFVEIACSLAMPGGALGDALFDRALTTLGERKLVETVALIGHYSLVGVLVNGFGVKMLPGDPPTF